MEAAPNGDAGRSFQHDGHRSGHQIASLISKKLGIGADEVSFADTLHELDLLSLRAGNRWHPDYSALDTFKSESDMCAGYT